MWNDKRYKPPKFFLTFTNFDPGYPGYIFEGTYGSLYTSCVIVAKSLPNKNANFGYSSTHPSLLSEIEEVNGETFPTS